MTGGIGCVRLNGHAVHFNRAFNTDKNIGCASDLTGFYKISPVWADFDGRVRRFYLELPRIHQILGADGCVRTEHVVKPDMKGCRWGSETL